ncbi:ligase-associated DNA damage response DEXH box helicase [Pseudoxanthomonas sp. SL93]|uniref:ligase-associated DNA damage response DEXH box helicase n=1 Tax=Pseudoxanthomonas sp. SL93 TaxID=2995142 RepID=UPI00226E0407|nr:ligase-associated DNA damage response DEXH box helicase [Pseudoxanthomonas sp. SL93]WAC64745.1 ligase-associated DNA damage response DEXH box helicase [Pseudoxanthomonas sp. SL93]
MTRSATPRESATPRQRLAGWFTSRGWKPLPFQREAWKHYLAGESGLIHTPTGSGKTLAAVGGVLIEAMADAGVPVPGKRTRQPVRPLRVLWITPLRALAADTTRALAEVAEHLGVPWNVAQRTGDASARDKRMAREGKLDALVTTPESLSLLLSYPDTAPMFSGLRCIVVDEWHELLGSKRGVQVQLALARMRVLSPEVRTWGLSATLGNLEEAGRALLPPGVRPHVIAAARARPMTLETVLPPARTRFPWGGHLGLSQLSNVLERVLAARTSLVFANTRAQAELWHQALAAVWPEDPATLALHHGSLAVEVRARAEAGLRDATLRCVVATSSLDLGVDFPSVDQVIQIGSPKGVARLLQRAGRARHRPGESGHVVCVPTHALELAEFAAARLAIAAGDVESRHPPRMPLDVLAQHCVTLALGGGFDAASLLAEVRRTDAFATLDDASWRRVLDFVVRGGDALEHYPEYRRVVLDEDGMHRMHDRRAALRHRLSIGTIASDGAIAVKVLRGSSLGSVEEGFITRLRPGDRFRFAGRLLELVRLHDMTAYVRTAKRGDGVVPRWMGGRLPLSSRLTRQMEQVIAHDRTSVEMRALAPLLSLQARLSRLPAPGTLVVEVVQRREGQHVFLFAFASRPAHEGLAALLAWRLGRQQPNTFSLAANDHGLMLSPQLPIQLDAPSVRALLDPHGVLSDLGQGANLAELARRQFRGIARVAGLLPPSLPGRAPRSLRQVQASSGLLFDVLQQHDPDHLLLSLAQREALEDDLQLDRILAALADLSQREIVVCHPGTLTPFSFPLWADGMRGHLSTEDWQTRVRRAAEQLERRHGG